MHFALSVGLLQVSCCCVIAFFWAVPRRIRSKEKCDDFRELERIFAATALQVLCFSILISWRAVLDRIEKCWIQNLAGCGCKVHGTTKMFVKHGALSQIIFFGKPTATAKKAHCFSIMFVGAVLDWSWIRARN